MAERPLDCSNCKKPLEVCYTEIVGESITRIVMCADCPHLKERLYGIAPEKKEHVEFDPLLSCGGCNTTLEEIRKGGYLGCMQCYETFANALIQDLTKAHLISRHLTSNKKTQPLHIGRAKGDVSEISSTLQLIALNEALDEMLVREDYEQAALLRDQIETLKDHVKQDKSKS